MYHIFRAAGPRAFIIIEKKPIAHRGTTLEWMDDVNDRRAAWSSRQAAHSWAKTHIKGEYIVRECVPHNCPVKCGP